MTPTEADGRPLDFSLGEFLFYFAYEAVHNVAVLVGLLLCIVLLVAVIVTVILRRFSPLQRGPRLWDDPRPEEPASWWLGKEPDRSVRHGADDLPASARTAMPH